MAIVITICAFYALFCLFTLPAEPVITPDSADYLSAAANRPLGYPFVLALLGPRGAMYAQPIIFSSALAFLGRETIRATARPWLAVAVVAGSMAVPQVRSFHASILTESLFLSLLIAFLALTIRFVQRPAWGVMAGVATVVGVSATVRRTGFAFVPVMIALVLLQRHRLSRSLTSLMLVAATAPFLAIVGTEQFAAWVVHAGQPSGLVGRHLFAKAALVDAPPATTAADPLHTQLEQHLAVGYAPIRDLLRRAPRDVRAVLTLAYETCLQGPCADRSRALMPEWPEPAQTGILGEAGLARLARAPMNYARLTALHYGSLWTVDRLRHPDVAPALTQFVASNRPLPFEREAFRADPSDPISFTGSWHVRYLQAAVSALGLITAALALAGGIAVVAKPALPPALAVACLAALTGHAGLVFTALLAAGFSRFTIGLWPAITTAALFGVWSLKSNAARKHTKTTK